ncbi:DNRLRE domain-containing protein [candidate division KSB1 bacterium]|nr:DNRLRE domain-containing protein [candidate division KSB1 bacterium]
MIQKICKYFFSLISTLLIISTACEFSKEMPGAFEEINPVLGEKKKETFYPLNIESRSRDAKFGDSPYLFLGQYNGYKSYIVTRIYVNGLANIDSTVINSVSLALFPVKFDSTETNNPQYTARVRLLKDMEANWLDADITWSSFNQSNFQNSIISETELGASQDETVYFKLDVSKFTTTKGRLDSTLRHYGLLIEFDAPEGQNAMRGFYSCDVSDATQLPTLTIVSTYNGVTDTTYFSSGHDASILQYATTETETSPFFIVGNTFNGAIQFPTLPLAQNATINRAQLILQLDTTRTFYAVNDVVSTGAKPAKWGEDPSTSISYSSLPVAHDTLKIDVRVSIQDWISKDDTYSDGFQINSTLNDNDIMTMFFYNTLADSILRPRLVVEYTLPPSSLK